MSSIGVEQNEIINVDKYNQRKDVKRPIRKALSKKLRFEVFKRDAFACQYCGQSAPLVALHVDHIVPVASGGKNNTLNLITSCIDCNLGKGARTLDDNSVAVKQMKAAKEISERKEQLVMMAKWKQSLGDLINDEIDVYNNRFKSLCNRTLNDSGRLQAKKTIKKYGIDAALSALETSFDQYVTDPSDVDQIEKSINYVEKICFWSEKRKTNPEVDEFSLICGIAAKRWYNCSKPALWKKVNYYFYECSVSTETLKNIVCSSRSWTSFCDGVDSYLAGGKAHA